MGPLGAPWGPMGRLGHLGHHVHVNVGWGITVHELRAISRLFGNPMIEWGITAMCLLCSKDYSSLTGVCVTDPVI
jgi:hypothetical protein